MIFLLLEMIRGYLMPYPFWIRNLGKKGEYLARRHFHRAGYHHLDSNIHFHRGEIDLIMANYRQVLFIEVKTRKTRPGRRIGDMLSRAQEQRIRRHAATWLKQWEQTTIPQQFTLLLVEMESTGRFQISEARLK